MKRMIQNFIKLGLAGAVLWGIALYIVTNSPTAEEPMGEVKSAEADIAWLDTGDDGHDFTRAMRSAGLDPRPYDLNGNVMYFATGKVDKSPAEVEEIMQDVLVDFGVNSKSYAGVETAQNLTRKGDFTTKAGVRKYSKDSGASELSAAMMNGEVVPTERRKGYVQMSGVDYGKTGEELIEALGTGEISTLSDLNPQGYRFIEATQEPGGKTDIQAVWSGKGFDAKKMNNTAYKQQAADPNVPACVGCERQVRFQSLSPDEPQRSNRWNTRMSIDSTYRFYQTSMAKRGWRESGIQRNMAKIVAEFPSLGMNGRILNLEKKGKAMQIVLLPDGQGGTHVMSQERYSGAESVIPAPKKTDR